MRLGTIFASVALPLAALSANAQDRVCTVMISNGAQLEDTTITDQCEPGYACEIAGCTGWIDVREGSVVVAFKSKDNRSEIVEVKAGQRRNLADLEPDDSLSSAIRNLMGIFRGAGQESVPGGRYAMSPGVSAGDMPSAQIAVYGESLSFSIPDIEPDAVYVFYPADNASAVTRVPAVDGVFHLDAVLLTAGGRFRGGLEGGAMTAFQVASQEKLDRVAAELNLPSDLSAAAEAYRRALIFFDSGLSWNGRGELQIAQSKTIE